MLWGVVVRDPYEGGGPSPPRRDRWIAAILFDRDPFLDLVVYACPPLVEELTMVAQPPR